MALLSAACVLALAEAFLWQERYALRVAAWIMLVGAAATCITRTRAIAGRITSAGQARP
jgi:hypothetical protein